MLQKDFGTFAAGRTNKHFLGTADRLPVKIELRVGGSGVRRWHLELVSRLRSAGVGEVVSIRLTAEPALPSAVELLLSLERVIHRLPGPRPSDLISPHEIALPTDQNSVDLVIDLTASGEEIGGSSLRVRYDSLLGDGAIFAALVQGRVPTIEIERHPTGQIVARGEPSTENDGTLCQAYETITSRMIWLLISAIRMPASTMPGFYDQQSKIRMTEAARYVLRNLSHNAIRKAYQLCFFSPHWQIGWRFVTDKDVWDNLGLQGQTWKVLPDPGFRFFADPFPITWRGRTYLLFEDFNHRLQKGIISAVLFDSNGPAGPVIPILEESWHLSYPFVIEHRDELWMVPESSQGRCIPLYRADPFPTRWIREGNLLADVEASDATIVKHAERFWMLAVTRDRCGSLSDMLSIFMADDLLGRWTPHKGNPIVIDRRCARPAGNVISRHGRLWRPVQDCRGGYGAGLGLAEITQLDEDGFAQKVHKYLRPTADWPGRRLHTLNRSGTLECIDGSGDSPKYPSLFPGPFRYAFHTKH
jgi:hypothetical protein